MGYRRREGRKGGRVEKVGKGGKGGGQQISMDRENVNNIVNKLNNVI